MIKNKIEKIINISLIGLFGILFVGLGGNIVLKAGQNSPTKKTGINFEKRLQTLETELSENKISKTEYDSLAGIIYLQKQKSEGTEEESRSLEKIPAWVSKLGITTPENLKFDPVFSSATYADDPTEGFNSVTLVYTGTFENAAEAAAKIATDANLTIGGNFKSKGSPLRGKSGTSHSEISYLNYSLGNTDKDYLISVQVEPSGRLIIMATDNRQMNERLLSYEPLNNRQKNVPKQKKQ